MENLIRLLDEFHLQYEKYYNLYLPSGRKDVYMIDIFRAGKWYRVTHEDPDYYLCLRDADPVGRLGYPDTDYLFIDLINDRIF